MKKGNMQAPIGIPIVASLVAFVLVTLALFAGQRPGFMEDYSMVALNTSMLGQNLIPTKASDGQPSKTSQGCISGVDLGPLDKACNAATSAAGAVETTILGALDDLGDDIADKLAEKLGIMEFYSLHVLDICEGNYMPDATSSGAKRDVHSCTAAFDTSKYNVTALFDHELQVGPLKLSTAQLGFTDDLNKAFDTFTTLLKALAIVFIIAMGLTGLSMLGSVGALFVLPRMANLIYLLNAAVATLALLALLAGSIAATVGSLKAENEINERGHAVGLAAEAGRKFLAIVWSATILMIVTTAYWIVCEFQDKRGHGLAYARRRGSGSHMKKIGSFSPQMSQRRRAAHDLEA